MTAETCTWCGNDVEAGDGYQLAEPEGGRVAWFCRLEHVVPWAIQGAHWEVSQGVESPGPDSDLGAACALCSVRLGDAQLVLVRHRAEHRIADRFCSVDHLLEWAKKGGRWSL